MFDLLDVYICSDMCCDLHFDIYIYIHINDYCIAHTYCICNLQLIIYLKNPLQKKTSGSDVWIDQTSKLWRTMCVCVFFLVRD